MLKSRNPMLACTKRGASGRLLPSSIQQLQHIENLLARSVAMNQFLGESCCDITRLTQRGKME